jgi:hypothetical protein
VEKPVGFLRAELAEVFLVKAQGCGVLVRLADGLALVLVC